MAQSRSPLAAAVTEQVDGPISSIPAVLDDLVAAAKPSVLRPLAFFVSWQGVLVLAYSGWSASLRDLKQQITANIAALPKEASGAQWPKSSLAALKDNQRLTPQQLQTLQAICSRASTAFAAPQQSSTGDSSADSSTLHTATPLLIDRLSLIMYDSRSLERPISRKVLQLAAIDPDTSQPPPEELARVRTILAEPNDKNYWFHASRDGSREAHYRGQALGVTLVHELASSPPAWSSAGDVARLAAQDVQAPVAGPGVEELLAAVQTLQEAVEKELPGMYAFFNTASLHVTVRGLLG